jgi:hypothetical protein
MRGINSWCEPLYDNTGNDSFAGFLIRSDCNVRHGNNNILRLLKLPSSGGASTSFAPRFGLRIFTCNSYAVEATAPDLTVVSVQNRMMWT